MNFRKLASSPNKKKLILGVSGFTAFSVLGIVGIVYHFGKSSEPEHDKNSTSPSPTFSTTAIPPENEGVTHTTLNENGETTGQMVTKITPEILPEDNDASVTTSIPWSVSMTPPENDEQTEIPTSKTFVLSYNLNRKSQTPVKISCSIPDDTTRCPNYMRAFQQIEKRNAIDAFEKTSSLDASVSRSTLIINDSEYKIDIKMKHLYSGLAHLGGRKQLSYDDRDFNEQNWDLGLTKIEISLFSNDSFSIPNVTGIKCTNDQKHPTITCDNLQRILVNEDFLRNIARREKAVMGAERLIGKVIMGVDLPWVVTQVVLKGHTDGKIPVKDHIWEFNGAELSLCSCIDAYNTTGTLQSLETYRQHCYEISKMKQDLRAVMDSPQCKSDLVWKP